ncbi:MAG: sigma-70 family RNA polymerase sigma factor [Planctomycetes bacterium]|nr:sigma-70 family RNA polymerase sigma factor [Planctomycetota bacterium]
MTLERSLPLETLLAETDHVTALARALVADAATADDVAQATWLDVLRAERRSIVDPRAWLATIVRRRALRARRTEARRSRRERLAADATHAAAAPSAADLAERVATHRELVDAVLALDEPYRATIVLRFFENLDAAAIAARTGSKRNTVRSRLQRGLQLLRERLDRAPGGRARWLPAVLAVGARRTTLEAAGGAVAGGIAFAIAMKKLALVAATAAVLLVAVAFGPAWLGPTDVAPPPDGAAPVTAAATASVEPPSAPARDRAEPTPPVERTAAAAAPTAASPGVRRVVDRGGRPLAGVVLRAQSPAAVRWQGGDRGWIRGADRTIRIDAALENRLLREPGYAAQFFAELPAPDEWRATVLGTPLPEREATADGDGGFMFAKGLEVRDDSIDVVSPLHVLVVPGSAGRAPWICAPATRVEGMIRDLDGKPIADAFALALRDAGSRDALHGQLPMRSDADGAFLIRRAIAGGHLLVQHDGYEPALVPLDTLPRQTVDVVLRRPHERDRLTIDGTVADGGGRPIAGAKVWFGRQNTTTGADGRFALDAGGAQPQYALTVLAEGFAALQQDDFGATLAAKPATGRNLLLVLRDRPRELRGVVFDANGAPRSGVWVGLVDPTLLDVSFAGVEGRLGGWDGGVRTAADGTFALGGLAERRYRLRAVDPDTGASATSAPLASGADGVVLRLPPTRRGCSGRVTADGQPLRGATVEVGWCTHVTKGGGWQMDATTPTTCDDDGRFVLPTLPARDAWLCVRVAGAMRQLVPVEAFARSSSAEIECDGTRWLQLVAGGSRYARPVAFELADGAVIAAEGVRGRALLDADGNVPPCRIPRDAVAVHVGRAPDARRLVLTDDLAVHLRVP